MPPSAQTPVLLVLGVFWGGGFFHLPFPSHALELAKGDINILELLVVMVAIKIFGRELAGKKIKLFSDNWSVVCTMNTRRARNKVFQKIHRELAFLQAIHDFQLKVEFLPGIENRAADLLSRWHLCPSYGERFFETYSLQFHLQEVYVWPGLFTFSNHW